MVMQTPANHEPVGSPCKCTWLVAGAALLALTALAVWWMTSPGSADAGKPSPTPLLPSPDAPDGPAWFRDVTENSGLSFTYRNGEEADQYTILESLGGGVALIDYDGDGLLDLFVTGGGFFDGADKTQIKGHPCKLFK